MTDGVPDMHGINRFDITDQVANLPSTKHILLRYRGKLTYFNHFMGRAAAGLDLHLFE